MEVNLTAANNNINLEKVESTGSHVSIAVPSLGSKITIDSTAEIENSAGSITLKAPEITNNGTIKAKDFVEFSSDAGLKVKGDGSLNVTGGPGEVRVSAAAGKTLSFEGIQTFDAGGGKVIWSAAGTGGFINVLENNSQNIGAGSSLEVVTPHIALRENVGLKTTNGGSISIDSGDANAVARLTAVNSGKTTTLTTSGGGGNISIKGAGVTLAGADSKLELDTSSVTGNGGSITLSSTTENVQNSTAHLTLKSTGNIGGDITATSSQAAVNLNKTDITADTVDGNLPNAEGGRVSISAAKTVTLSGPIQTNSNHKGGSIEISGSSIAVSNDPPNSPPLKLTARGESAGGTIKLTAGLGTIDLKKFDAAVTPSGVDADGGMLVISASQGQVLFSDSDISVDGTGSGKGGNIIINAKSFQFSTTNTNMSISANGGKNGGGGSITVKTQNDILIDTAGLKAFSLSALGSSNADGGTIRLESAGSIVYKGGIASDTEDIAGQVVINRSSGSIWLFAAGKLSLLNNLELANHSNSGAIELKGQTINLALAVHVQALGNSDSRTITIEAVGSDPAALSLAGKNLISTSSFGSPNRGGNIHIKSGGGISVGSASLVSANGENFGGTITIQAASATLTLPELEAIAVDDLGTGGTINIIGTSNNFLVDFSSPISTQNQSLDLTTAGNINFVSSGALSVSGTGQLNGLVSLGQRLTNGQKIDGQAKSADITYLPTVQLHLLDARTLNNLTVTAANISVFGELKAEDGLTALNSNFISNNGTVSGKQTQVNVLSGTSISIDSNGNKLGVFEGQSPDSGTVRSPQINLSGHLQFQGNWTLDGATSLNISSGSIISIKTNQDQTTGNLLVSSPRIELNSTLDIANEFTWITTLQGSTTLDRTGSAGASITSKTMVVNAQSLTLTEGITGGNAALIANTKMTITAGLIFGGGGFGLSTNFAKSDGDMYLYTNKIEGFGNTQFSAKNIYVIDPTGLNTDLINVSLRATNGNITVQNTLGGSINVGLSTSLNASGSAQTPHSGIIYLLSGSPGVIDLNQLKTIDYLGLFYASAHYPGPNPIFASLNEPYQGGGLIMYGNPGSINFGPFIDLKFSGPALLMNPIQPITHSNERSEEQVIVNRNTEFRPVSLVQSIMLAGKRETSLKSVSSTKLSCWFVEDSAKVRFNDESSIEHYEGEIIVMARSAASITFDASSLQLEPESVCVINKKGHQVELTVLHDEKISSVTIIDPRGNRFPLHCGEQALIGKPGKKEHVRAARRRKQEYTYGENGRISVSEVSIVSLAASSDLLTSLFKTKTKTEMR